jgi:septum site-determining protein MinC
MDNNELQPSGSADVSGVVSARGTEEGLIIRIDGRADQHDIQRAVRTFLEQRRRYLSGQEVTVEWVGVTPDAAFVESVSRNLLAEFEITVRRSRTRPSMRLVQAEREAKEASKVVAIRPHEEDPVEEESGIDALFGGVGDIFSAETGSESGFSRRSSVSDPSFWDDADARVIYTTLRSGQRVETEHSVVVFGDVNSGAEIIAGGDIIVLGTLRGVAHAGAYDTSGGGRVIFALSLRPTQLRIGMVITRGAIENSGKAATVKTAVVLGTSEGAELARVEGNNIVVEHYQARKAFQRPFRGASGV